MVNFSVVATLCALLSFPLLYSQNKNVQNFEVYGVVVDSLGNPIANAVIIFNNVDSEKEYETLTDFDGGIFKMLLPTGNYTFQVNALGYAGYKDYFFLNNSKQLPNVILREETVLLDEVVITTKLNKKITHNATGVYIDVKNDSILKNVAVDELLTYLPEVRVTENGDVLLQGELAAVNIDGKFQKISRQTLISMLANIKGSDVKGIELISSPSAKYDGSLKKIINIYIQKEKNDGLKGSVANRITNVDFSITPTANVSYKTGKFIFTLNTLPYSYDEKSSKGISMRRLLDNSIRFDENIRRANINTLTSFSLDVDYTINDYHSFYVNYGISKFDNKSSFVFNSSQFSFDSIEKSYFTDSRVLNNMDASLVNFGYRYDIGKDGMRVDMSGSYKHNSDIKKRTFLNSESDADAFNSISRAVDDVSDKIKELSYRVDFTLPLSGESNAIEAGIKYDDLAISNKNTFQSEMNDFEIENDYSNRFDYNEKNTSLYASINNNYKRLKYSFGMRFEYIAMESISIADNAKSTNTYRNVLPVVALKYMVNKSETDNVSISYRKGYLLPPYIYLNQFETFVNSNTVRKGNQNLTQSIYHNLILGYTLNNKYFMSLNYYNYDNYFAISEIIEADRTIISYNNIGSRTTYRFYFNTNYNLYTWWRLYIDASYDYKTINRGRVDNSVSNYFLSLNNTFKMPKDIQMNLITSVSNGNSTGYETPNNFIRFFSTASVTKQFLNNKLHVNLRAVDIFGVNNKNEQAYRIDDIEYTHREIFQAPKLFFNVTYRFNSGKEINKKNKNKSSIDSGRH